MINRHKARAIRWAVVLWPAFMGSIVLEALLFTLFDPVAMRWTDSLGEPMSPMAVYSLGFLAIWACMALTVALAISQAHSVEPGPDGRR